MKTFTLTVDYHGDAESWEEIRDDAENNKITKVFIGTKEFVNVVRCKDCKYRYKEDIAKDQMFCTLHRKTNDKSYFCADGKREEQEDEE